GSQDRVWSKYFLFRDTRILASLFPLKTSHNLCMRPNPGVKVKWVDVPWAAIQSKILSAVSANKAPDLGRFAVIQDPQGAVLSIIAYTSPESQKIA
ncbi:MAG: hypothetical protein ACFCU8_21475, partial [Thermosynechococcaceae cyanobacterium]